MFPGTNCRAVFNDEFLNIYIDLIHIFVVALFTRLYILKPIFFLNMIDFFQSLSHVQFGQMVQNSVVSVILGRYFYAVLKYSNLFLTCVLCVCVRPLDIC